LNRPSSFKGWIEPWNENENIHNNEWPNFLAPLNMPYDSNKIGDVNIACQKLN